MIGCNDKIIDTSDINNYSGYIIRNNTNQIYNLKNYFSNSKKLSNITNTDTINVHNDQQIIDILSNKINLTLKYDNAIITKINNSGENYFIKRINIDKDKNVKYEYFCEIKNENNDPYSDYVTYNTPINENNVDNNLTKKDIVTDLSFNEIDIFQYTTNSSINFNSFAFITNVEKDKLQNLINLIKNNNNSGISQLTNSKVYSLKNRSEMIINRVGLDVISFLKIRSSKYIRVKDYFTLNKQCNVLDDTFIKNLLTKPDLNDCYAIIMYYYKSGYTMTTDNYDFIKIIENDKSTNTNKFNIYTDVNAFINKNKKN